MKDEVCRSRCRSLNLKISKRHHLHIAVQPFQQKKRTLQKSSLDFESCYHPTDALSYCLCIIFRNQTAPDHIKPQTDAASVMPGDINAYLFVS